VLPQPGVVHLNVPFRDPLVPIDNGVVASMKAEVNEAFFAHLEPSAFGGMAESKVWQRPTTTRGLIVAGPEMSRDPGRYAEIVSDLSASLGWPILADGVSPLRSFPTKEAAVIGSYDTILRNEKKARDLVPRYVLCLGSWPTSKVLRGWLEQSGAEIVLVTERMDNRDCLHGRTRHMRVPVETLASNPKKTVDTTYARLWREADDAMSSALRETERPHANFEGDIAPALARSLPGGTPMYVASSMAIRDVEYFWPVSDQGVRMYFNRGANGIDGTLSTALGIAHGNKPSVLLTGDLAFLHDSNGLMLRKKFVGSLTVVLINNNGGGIFEHLPVAQFNPPFEEYFATPQSVDFANLCAANQVEHVAVRDLAHLSELTLKLPLQGIRVLEITTDRKRDAAFRKKLFTQAAAKLA
jgi:2-succinyl-5-enolpyruvyl-6-hydroxy-3-cyclohexene-1-carboxylate synthase